MKISFKFIGYCKEDSLVKLLLSSSERIAFKTNRFEDVNREIYSLGILIGMEKFLIRMTGKSVIQRLNTSRPIIRMHIFMNNPLLDDFFFELLHIQHYYFLC